MTTENIDNTSALDQDQAQLDAVQEDPNPQTDSSSTGELRALRDLVENQNKMIENQNRQVAGLQSKIDTGLNGIRRDSEEAVRKQQEQQAYAYMQSLPEEHQAAFGQMLQANQAYYQQNSQLRDQLSGQVDNTQQAQPEATSEWEQVYAIPRSLGIDPQTQGIDYAAFTEPGLNESQRRDRFFASLKPLMGATNQAPATQAQQQPAPGQVQSPPAGGTPSNGASSNMRSIEQVQTAYIEGKLSKEEYTDQLNKLGQ